MELEGLDDDAVVAKVCSKVGVARTSLKIVEVGRLPARPAAARAGANAAGDGAPAKPRPLKIVFEDTDSKWAMLRAAKALRDVEHWGGNAGEHGRGGVFIQQDLTYAERQREFQLRAEKRRRTAAGETDLVIRNGKIVVRGAAGDGHPGRAGAQRGGGGRGGYRGRGDTRGAQGGHGGAAAGQV